MLRGYEAPMEFEYSEKRKLNNENSWMSATANVLSEYHASGDLMTSSRTVPFTFGPSSANFNTGSKNNINNMALGTNERNQNSQQKKERNDGLTGEIAAQPRHHHDDEDKDILLTERQQKLVSENDVDISRKDKKHHHYLQKRHNINEKPRKRPRPSDFILTDIYPFGTAPAVYNTKSSDLYHHENSSSIPSSGRNRKLNNHTSDHSYYAHLPYLLIQYIQLFFSLFIIGTLCYIIIQFITTVQHDLKIKQEEYIIEITQKIQECSKHYSTNRCDPQTRIPAIEQMCNEWEICMMKDPKEVGQLQMGAETIAEILNKLVDPLSYKTMLFSTVLFFGALMLASSAFSAITRSKTPNITHITTTTSSTDNNNRHLPISIGSKAPNNATNAVTTPVAFVPFIPVAHPSPFVSRQIDPSLRQRKNYYIQNDVISDEDDQIFVSGNNSSDEE